MQNQVGFLFALAAAPIVATLVTAQPAAAARELPTWYVGVHDADAVVRINGVVEDHLVPSSDKGTATMSYGDYPRLCENGDNTLSIDVTIHHPGGYGMMRVTQTVLGPTVFEKQLTENGTLHYSVHVAGAPAWSWTKADSAADDKAGLLAALTDFEAAVAAKDVTKVLAAIQPALADQRTIGADPGDPSKFLGMVLETGIPQPVPAKDALLISPSSDGRLFSVTDSTYQAPVRLKKPTGSGEIDFGQYWARIGGTWLIVIAN